MTNSTASPHPPRSPAGIERITFTGDRLTLRDWRQATAETRPVVEVITRLDAEAVPIAYASTMPWTIDRRPADAPPASP